LGKRAVLQKGRKPYKLMLCDEDGHFELRQCAPGEPLPKIMQVERSGKTHSLKRIEANRRLPRDSYYCVLMSAVLLLEDGREVFTVDCSFKNE
jgi:hypothetical protein